MKVVLTGKNSYISNHCCSYLKTTGIDADCISVRNGIDNINFSGVDVVIHCAAVVHKKEKDFANLYDTINYKLTKQLAEKAKECGVSQFVFLSTMAVYGDNNGAINKNTPLKPVTLYGKSKLKAEECIKKMECDTFKISVIRPPMVYGKNCPGNYGRLSKLSKLMPILPDVNNIKSFVYIDNLAYFVRNVIVNERAGVFNPMDDRNVSTTELMKNISNKPTSRLLGKLISVLPLSIAKKAFGSLYYDEDIADKIYNIAFEEAVRLSEQ